MTVNNGQASDVPHDIRPGLTGPRSAVLGPLIIELVQPVSKVQGLLYRVFFDVDSAKIDQDQKGHRRDDGDNLDKFIHESLLSTYEVRVALDSGLLPVRGEARASVAYRGNAADRIRYNQQLSEKRKAAVVDWLTCKGIPNMKTNLIQAVGDSKAKSNEEIRRNVVARSRSTAANWRGPFSNSGLQTGTSTVRRPAFKRA